ncbi:uncharacterized protein N7482_001232 [Penicillium canariense]|uniref:Uncharacterized protein n=1 Tax=Penicillium canariense TaxID=189055 RepID=A0A9W9LTD5_9EURO|nr:uncharacterized protein N7482_001232 [Penicillium canariense]KAJ5175355.1 hypothetical protein N7482_001232 [Penicillium canariense]
MRADALSLLTAFALGGFELVAAEHVERPRYYFPREVKRTVRNGTNQVSSRAADSWAAVWQSIEDSLTAPTTTITTPAAAATDAPKQVIVVISSDAAGHVHTLTTSTEVIAAAQPTATTTTTTKSDTTATTSSSGNVLSDVGTDVSNLLGLGASSSAINSTSVTATGTKGSTPLTTSTAAATTTSQGGLLESLGIAIPSADNTTATASSTIPINVPASSTASPTTTAGGDLIGTIVSGITSGLGSLLPNATETSTSASGIGLIPTPGLPTSSGVPHLSIPLTATTGPDSATTSVGIIPTPHFPGVDSTGTPTSGAVPTPTGNTHETSKVPTLSVPYTTTAEPATSVPVEPQPTQTPAESSTSNSSNWIPSSILVLPTSTPAESTSSGTKTATDSEPTSLPGSITPSNGVSEAPSDSLLLQLGFDSHLPWSFVATTPLSSSQIFEYIPQALKYAMPLASSTMWALEPYYSWQSTGYNATLAIFYFPRDKVQALKDLKLNPNSALYQQQSESVKTLMSMIDPSIPLEFAGNYPSSDGSSSSSTGGSESGNGGSTDGNNNSDGSANSSKAKASSVGIGVGVVAGAAAYGAGMFWVARRYRKRKQLHQRSSSTAEQMSQGGSVFAAGARMSGSQRTARSQMISAPVMAENSLGWN